jgi:hypothetical protein
MIQLSMDGFVGPSSESHRVITMPSPAPARNSSEKLDKTLAQSHRDATRRTGKLNLERPWSFGWKNVAWVLTPFLIAYLTYRFQPGLPSTHAVCVSGGTIYTAEPDSPFVECIAVKGNRISFVGKRDDLEQSHAQPGWLPWPKFSYSTNAGQLAIDTLDGEVSLLPGQ